MKLLLWFKRIFKTANVLLVSGMAIGSTSIATATELISINDVPSTKLSTSETTESLLYLWKTDNGDSCTVKIRHTYSNDWTLQVPHNLPGSFKSWQDDINRFRGHELLEILKDSLTDFRQRETSGTVRYIEIGAYLAPEIWDPYVRGLRNRLQKLPPYAEPSLGYLSKLSDETLTEIAFVKEISSVVRQAGFAIQYGPRNTLEKSPYFPRRDETWIEVLAKPNLGMAYPGYLSFYVSENSQ